MTDTLDHTDHKPKHRKRSPHGMGQYVTDSELIEYLGVPERIARATIAGLDQNKASGFPPKQPLWGDRRYLPAVEEWLRKTNGLKVDAPKGRSGP